VCEELEQKAVAAAKGSEVAIVMVGLPERCESEAYDRQHLRLLANQEAIIRAISQVQGKQDDEEEF